MKVLTIAGRELASLLGSIIGWLVITAFTFIAGVAFVVLLIGYVDASQQAIEQPWLDLQVTYADYLLAPFFNFQLLILLFLIPGVTMRLFSEELRQHTLELLLTSPLSIGEIVLGKFIGAMAFVSLLLVFASWPAPFLAAWTDVDLTLFATGLGGVWLASACVVGLGMAFSASTPHQTVAFVLTVGLAFGIYLLSAMSDVDPTGLLEVLSPASHVADLQQGLVRLSDLVFFGAWIGVCLLFTQQRLALRRWS